MIDSPALLADLKRVLKSLEDDLRVRAEDDSTEWGARLRDEHRRAQARERTGMAWIQWRDGEVSQAAVAWIIATVFIRFAEDNGLLAGAELDGARVAAPWITAPGEGLERAVENEAAFYAASPTRTSRDWLQQAFRALAALPAGRPLVNPDHSPVWHAPISATAADALLVFFRRTTPDGALVHDFSDPDLGTRFLGDLYQDLSDYAKKTYALLQTPEFVEEFILDLTLTPAIAEFGLTGLKLIDPACGSGHFLLGAFHRLVEKWAETAPGVERGERVQRALDSIHGVDLNPFAIAIARFRLTVAAIKAAEIPTLVAAPAFKYHLAIGDSLLGSVNPNAGLDLGDDEYFEYNSEDLREYAGILRGDQYHVVVANPPYIQPPDARARDRYRAMYSTCSGKYALSVPFMELLFRLAKRADGGGAGYVGQITSNSFMKREFGKGLIERFLSGVYTGVAPDYVDLTHILDTSGAYIPGHGTPTTILVGRPRKPSLDVVRTVLGVRAEPSQPRVAAKGLVWKDIVDHLEQPGYDGPFVSVADLPRETYASFPWSLSGGGAGELKSRLEANSSSNLAGALAMPIGFASFPGNDDPFFLNRAWFRRHSDSSAVGRDLVIGEYVRDWVVQRGIVSLVPRDDESVPVPFDTESAWGRHLWLFRSVLRSTRGFGGESMGDTNTAWWAWYRWIPARYATPLCISYAEVATQNHFVLDRGGRAFKQTAPVITLAEGASESDHFALLGPLNSSVGCFWLQQVSYQKGAGSGGEGIADEKWEWRYQFNATKLHEFPLPRQRAAVLTRRMDEAARARVASSPTSVLDVSEPTDLHSGRSAWVAHGREMVALQEELDWRMYVAYGLAAPELAPELPELIQIDPNERVFEINLARSVVAGGTDTAWFDRHRRAPLTEFPTHWPEWYRNLAELRLAAIELNPSLRLLEQPEYKRRWAGPTWDQLVKEAVQTVLLDRLEANELWHDASGRPLVRSAAQIADDLRRDESFRELLVIHTGSQDHDLAAEVGRLLAGDAVPGLAALRYKSSGLEKFRAWEHTWELQRAEDRGERVEVPVPPKYGPTDFVKTSYWSARGKLDVPKERFISFPGSKLPDDATDVYGWAGWDHGERGQAVARFANDLTRAGASDVQVVPLVGVLLELEPWLKQWHDDIDARSGVSPAAAVAGITNALLGRLGMGRDQIIAWRPPAPTRGRRNAK